MPDDPQEAFNEKARDSLTTRAGQEGAKDVTREMEMILEEAFEEGKAEGIAEVIAEERAAREKIGEARFAAMMLKDGRYSFEEILKMTGLSAERVIEAKGRLEGMTEIAEKMLNDGYPIKEILSKTGLTAEQIRWVREAEGRAEGKAELAAMMLKDGRYSLEEILDMTGLSAEQVIEATAKYGDK